LRPRDGVGKPSGAAVRDKHLLREIERALSESSLKPELLELEITESMVMRTPELEENPRRDQVDGHPAGDRRLRHGLFVPRVDQAVPFDCIKIDRSFIKDYSQDPDDVASRRRSSDGAQPAAEVIAEGVETQEQLDFLTEHGCHEFQGYFFRRPQPAEDLSKRCATNAGR